MDINRDRYKNNAEENKSEINSSLVDDIWIIRIDWDWKLIHIKKSSKKNPDPKIRVQKIWHLPTLPGRNPVPSAIRDLTSLFGMGRGEHPWQKHHKNIYRFLHGNNNVILGVVNREYI